MKIKLKNNDLHFPGINHFIVAELPNGDFRFYKWNQILSVSATRRIVNQLKMEA